MNSGSPITKKKNNSSGFKQINLLLGPAVFSLMMLIDVFIGQEIMSDAAWKTAGMGIWMAIWWATEAVPVAATAFLPLALFSILGIAPMKAVAAPYANPTIFLFLGAFILSLAVQRWHLHTRIALTVLTLTGTNGRHLVAGFMLVSALLSMWMTNTSTTAMLLPIGVSVGAVIAGSMKNISTQQSKKFQVALLLGLAYAATIGGLATLVGTPPNAFLASYLAENYDLEISFFDWMLVGVPVSAVLLPLTWMILTRGIKIPASKAVSQHLQEMRTKLGPISKPEKRVALVFCLVVLAWILRRPLANWIGIEGLSDAGIVMFATMMLFAIPSGDTKQGVLMTWSNISKLPWGVLILFGGGLSLASAVDHTGLAQWLGESLAPLNTFGLIPLLVATVVLVIFLTELTSNLATTATFLPVIAAIAVQSGYPPLVLCASVALAASCAFMLPVATPPNAIVFSSGHLSIQQMMKKGFLVNLLGLFVVSVVVIWLLPLVFGL